ncbi:MAG: hypothetical protein ABS917_05310 [Solibacillus sp.]|uniref:hypothetical protein n=1 Tax=Solibacillus sp. TaxID=1909654 RepID=UPI003314F324
MTKLNTLIQKCETQKVVSAKLVKGVLGHLRSEELKLKKKHSKAAHEKNIEYQALKKQFGELRRENTALRRELEKYRAEENK